MHVVGVVGTSLLHVPLISTSMATIALQGGDYIICLGEDMLV